MKRILFILFIIPFIGFGQCDPSNLSAYTGTVNQVTLSWTGGSATSFQLKWRILGSTTA